MKIVADENIPYSAEAFSCFGSVTRLPASAIDRLALQDAEILLVRSVTRVDQELLEDSPIQFVGTATIGVDHVDRAWLQDNNIAFSSAPGCNANSVSEWFTAAVLEYAVARNIDLREKTLGIVGVGNVGNRVEAKARALGMEVLLNDPPRAEREGGEAFVDLETLLAGSDIVALHVPLERNGAHPTYRLADASFFEKLQEGALLLNSSRGDVVEEAALLQALSTGRLGDAILDVWETEPAISKETLQAAFLATPHIAGYSFDGKVAGTAMIQHACCKALGTGSPWESRPHLPPADVPEVTYAPSPGSFMEPLRNLVQQVYDITADHKRLLETGELSPEARGTAFTRLRKTYPRRREFPYTLARGTTRGSEAESVLSGLGFQTG